MNKTRLILIGALIGLILAIVAFRVYPPFRDLLIEEPLVNLNKEVKKGIEQEVDITRSEELKKIVEKNESLSQKLYPSSMIEPVYERWKKLSDFINEDGFSEEKLYENLRTEPDLLVLGWNHNFGNGTASEAAETLQKYISSGKEINYLIIEGFPRGHEAIEKFNQGEISPERLSELSRSKTPNSPWNPYGERGWNKILFETIRELKISLIGLEKRRNLHPMERMEAIPRWVEEIAREEGKGSILVGRAHINSYLFTRSTALWQIIDYRKDFLKEVEKLEEKAFIVSLPFKILVVDLYSQVDYSLNWDLTSSILLYMVEEGERLELFKQFKKEWYQEVEKSEEERVYRAPGNTFEKVFPDHQEPVVTPSNPPYLNATSVYLSLYPSALTRNFIFQPNQQGDFTKYELGLGSNKFKVMEINKTGKVAKIILPK